MSGIIIVYTFEHTFDRFLAAAYRRRKNVPESLAKLLFDAVYAVVERDSHADPS